VYDTWKATNPADEFLGPEPEEEECAMPDTELTVDDLLICLTEECAEVIHAATKCLRFGFHRVHLPYGVNDEVLAQEVGDLLAIIEALPLDTGIINAYKKLKIAKMQQAKQDFGR